MGYIHRDLKPDNIVLDLDPLDVRVIDFDLSVLDSVKTTGSKRGTPGYYPSWRNMRDGNPDWDIWAIGAMILEANMPKGEYINTDNES